jgi:predicted YcjX-like family ATPase
MPEVEFKENKQLVAELCYDPYNSEILRFFSRHPYARFDRQVLISGLGLSDTARIEIALEDLSGRKLLETKNGHGAPLYWLTRREPVHSAIKSVLAPRTHKTGDALDRLAMMQLIMPLGTCPVMAASAQ